MCLLNIVGIIIVLKDLFNECFIIFMVWIILFSFLSVRYFVWVGMIILLYVVRVLIISILSIGG